MCDIYGHDSIGGHLLPLISRVLEPPPKRKQDKKWTKDTVTQKHPVYTYHGVNLN